MQSMIPSSNFKKTTVGQINKAVSLYRALLEKHCEEFGAEPFQYALGLKGLANEQFGVLRKRVEAVSDFIIRRVRVDRNRTPKQVLDATGREQFIDRLDVDEMPKGKGDEVEVIFFKLDLTDRQGYISDTDLDKEYDLRGLKPADPYSVSAVNEADPEFADEKPNKTHWKNVKGEWCFVVFCCWKGGGRRGVNVRRNDHSTIDVCWYAGLRK